MSKTKLAVQVASKKIQLRNVTSESKIQPLITNYFHVSTWFSIILSETFILDYFPAYSGTLPFILIHIRPTSHYKRTLTISALFLRSPQCAYSESGLYMNSSSEFFTLFNSDRNRLRRLGVIPFQWMSIFNEWN